MISSFMRIAKCLLLLQGSVVLLLCPVVVINAAQTNSECSSSFVGEQALEGTAGVVLRQYVQSDAGTFTVQLSYPGQGWIGFGFGTKMKGSTAVIGLPGDKDPYSANPGLYNLSDYALDAVLPMPDEQGLLADASIEQTDDGTTLTFTLPTVLNGDTLVRAGELTNIIYAVGEFDTLAYHASRQVTQAYFTECGTAAPAMGSPTNGAPQQQPAVAPSPGTPSDGSTGNAPTTATGGSSPSSSSSTPQKPTGSRAPPSAYSCYYGVLMFVMALSAPVIMLL